METSFGVGYVHAMSDAANRIVQKLWSYCNVLRDDGLSSDGAGTRR